MNIVGFEHLHLHTTNGSLLDGYGLVEEYAQNTKKINQQFLCITDHGMMAAVPNQIACCDKHKLHPIFGIEIYYNPSQPCVKQGETMQQYLKPMSPEERKAMQKSCHMTLWAKNEIGYKNLVRLSSFGFLHGFYYKPRVNWEQLVQHKDGLMVGSGCYNSPVGFAFDRWGSEKALEEIKKYHGLFGENYYLEIMLLDFNKQKPYNLFLLQVHEKLGIPLVLTQDCHYCKKEDSKYQRLMLMVNGKRTVADMEEAIRTGNTEEYFELQDSNLWQKSEEELNIKWLEDPYIDKDLFQEAKRNTVRICEACKGVQLDRSIKLPQFPDEDDRLEAMVKEGAHKRDMPNTNEYNDRAKEEFALVKDKGFSAYFIIEKMMVDAARKKCPEILGWGTGSEAVGPGRGCLGPDSRIVMSNGITKRISEINADEFVITLDGSCQKVNKRHCYEIKEDLLRIKCYYGERNGVVLTNDHKVFAEKAKRPDNWENWSKSSKIKKQHFLKPVGDFQWIEAKDLVVGDWLFVPKIKGFSNKEKEIDLNQFSNEKDLCCDECFAYHNVINGLTHRINRIKKSDRFIELSKEWFRILGMFVGDGWLRTNNAPFVGFCFHGEDENNFRFLIEYMKSCGFKDYNIRKSKNKALTQVDIQNKFLYKLFKHLHPGYKCTASTKHVPEMVLNATDECVLSYLRGYGSADGHNGQNKYTFTTVSRNLADQIRYLCWRVGIPASLGYDLHGTNDKRADFQNSKMAYTINIPHDDRIGSRNRAKNYFYYPYENGVMLKIRSIDIVKNIPVVYDLSVDNNSNYLTSSFLVHNSGAGFLLNYLLGITDVDPVKHDLLSSRFLSPARGGKQMCIRFEGKPL